MQQRTLTIVNKLGLHARAAALLVSHAAHYSSEITLTRNGRTVNGKSIMGVMMLGASQGTEVELAISGDDEKEAIADLIALIENGFGEEE